MDRSRRSGHHERFRYREVQEVLMHKRHVVTGLLVLGVAYAVWMFAFGEESVPVAVPGEKVEMASGSVPGPAVASSDLARREIGEPVSPALVQGGSGPRSPGPSSCTRHAGGN